MQTAMTVPEQGQLVDVRQRRFIVTEVGRTALPTAVLRSDDGHQHLVSLTSVEDDALGEELQVVWEIEPSAFVHEKMALPEPTGFDDPRRLDAFLDAVRWGAASTADVRALQSPFRSGIVIEDYQLDPVVRAIQMPRVSLLIADDVGLGKTIESGLVIQELIVRHRARKILVVCPSSLQIQWHDQMRDKFGLEFHIVDSDLLKSLRRKRGIHANPWSHFPRLITSIDFFKRERPMRLFREVLPQPGEPTYPRRFDVLIVDEAHGIAPSGRGKYATDSMRTTAIRAIVPHFEHKLFLTATPHNGYLESFSALLELLDSQRFARGLRPDREQLGAVMVRRLKSELPPRWDGSPRFPERKLEALEVAYTSDEKHIHAALCEYTKLRAENATDGTERFATEFVLKLLKKRLFSSPEAFRTTLAQHERSLREAKRRRTSRAPSLRLLRQQIDKSEEDYANDAELEESTNDAVESATRLFHEPTDRERRLLKEMRDWAQSASSVPDAKAAELIRWLHETLKPKGTWSDTRVIIFTEYRATQKWLQTLFASEGLTEHERLLTLYGGMDSQSRERIKAAFQDSAMNSNVRILLATDAASEGIDLQKHCSRIIHYEIPWNPNRMEQRNGRVDRYGQDAREVLIYHFVGKGYKERQAAQDIPVGELEGDLEFLMRAAIKVNTIREDLGKVGAVIAQQVEEAMLGRRRRLQTEDAEKADAPARKLLKFERNLREQIDKLHAQLQETRINLRLSPDNIRSVVEIALKLAGQPPLEPVELKSVSGADKITAYRLPAFKGSWALCADGLAHPHTGEIRPVVFDQDLIVRRDDIVLAHLNHRLVQMSLRLLRAEVWSREGKKRLNRVAARIVPSNALDFPVVIAHARLVLIGGDSQRLHEEIITAGGILKEGRFSRLNVGQVRDALEAATPAEPSEAVKKKLADLWPKYQESLIASLEARMRDRTDGLQKNLAERADKEASDITTVLTELKETIVAELDNPEYEQMVLPGFSDMERDQFEQNTDSLRARIREIPKEIEQETKAIRARFADPQPRLFPVAITFLVPEKLARS